jgi:predicted anti-sigma-YlaC factor YlaD
MVRALLAAMVPCFAIGLTGLLVTTIGRTLLAMAVASTAAATITAMVLTILIMIGASIAASIADRSYAARATETNRH